MAKTKKATPAVRTVAIEITANGKLASVPLSEHVDAAGKYKPYWSGDVMCSRQGVYVPKEANGVAVTGVSVALVDGTSRLAFGKPRVTKNNLCFSLPAGVAWGHGKRGFYFNGASTPAQASASAPAPDAVARLEAKFDALIAALSARK